MTAYSYNPWTWGKEISINGESYVETTTPLCSRLSAKKAFILLEWQNSSEHLVFFQKEAMPFPLKFPPSTHTNLLT